MNKNMENMITELKNEFPKIYDRVNHGSYMLAIDETVMFMKMTF